ncbi:hypothetical protein HUK80_03615 [Flavobacterium sp. MAH-1]|uniref:Uncharacterized protein n=1 Tax=Flavobacterium agri TaxID=2743471 RepID=A0A7Y8Y084_9FLAO|nr:hypothetical protein [Flavobacterium agri]NUY79972.1 hypothetical protein [Flavobacterium agri]NYA69997.1 hypothetical protein [Flavobacterium agri]
MKKLIVVAVLFAGNFMFSQKDALLQKVAEETCKCIEDKKLDMSGDFENLKGQFGLCMIQSYTANSKAMGGEELEFDDSASIEKLGSEIGVKMLNICPDYILALGKHAIKEKQEAAAEETVLASVTGKILEIKTEQFVSIQVKDENGRTHTMLFLDYFDSASLFTEGNLKKGDKAKVSYNEIELYDPKMKEFRYYKVIAGLTK